MDPREALKVAYKFLDFYLSHLPKTPHDWEVLLDRTNQIVTEQGFLCDIMNNVLDEIERQSKGVAINDSNT